MLGVDVVVTNFAACASKGITILPTWYKYLPDTTVAGKCTPTIIFPDDLGKVALAVVEILLRLAAFAAIAYVMYGGFQYLMSQGEPDRLANARGTIINALIGLVLAMLATGIVSFVGRQFI